MKNRGLFWAFIVVIAGLNIYFNYAYDTVVIQCPTCATTQVTGLNVAGDYVFELRVMDNDSAWSAPDLVTIHVNDIPLPVTYLYFKANPEANNTNRLEWATAQEFNCSHFQIEYSTDGITWHYITTTPCAGNMTQVTKYTFRHVSAAYQTFYRLLQYDKDGKKEYSQVVKVMRILRAELFVENPVYSTVNITINSTVSSNCVISIFDISGRIVLQRGFVLYPGQNYNIIDFDKPKGVYIVSAKFGGNTLNKKITKL